MLFADGANDGTANFAIKDVTPQGCHLYGSEIFHLPLSMTVTNFIAEVCKRFQYQDASQVELACQWFDLTYDITSYNADNPNATLFDVQSKLYALKPFNATVSQLPSSSADNHQQRLSCDNLCSNSLPRLYKCQLLNKSMYNNNVNLSSQLDTTEPVNQCCWSAAKAACRDVIMGGIMPTNAGFKDFKNDTNYETEWLLSDGALCSTALVLKHSDNVNNHNNAGDYMAVDFAQTNVKYSGLVNQAQTCYLNSLLQTLFMTPQFRNAVYRWQYKGSAEAKKESIPYQLQHLFVQLQFCKRPMETVNLTDSFGWGFQNGFTPQDIHELWTLVIFSALENELLCATDNCSTAINADADTLESKAAHGNGIAQRFMTQYYTCNTSSVMQCLECGHTSVVDESNNDLMLHIHSRDGKVLYNSLEECLSAYIKPERMSGDNQYQCDPCKRPVDGIRCSVIRSLPPLLGCYLMRFNHFDHHHVDKLNHRVSFPLVLDMSPYMVIASEQQQSIKKEDDDVAKCCYNAGDVMQNSAMDTRKSVIDDCIENKIDKASEFGSLLEEDQLHDNGDHKQCCNMSETSCHHYKYELFSVMVHSGNMVGGHYFAYIKSMEDQLWYCFNDQHITQVAESVIESTYGDINTCRNAYFLMYRRIRCSRSIKVNTDQCCSCSLSDDEIFMLPEQFPSHIKEQVLEIEEADKLLQVMREESQNMYKVIVYCYHPGYVNLLDATFTFHKDTSYTEVITKVFTHYLLSELDLTLSNCRLIQFNHNLQHYGQSFDVIASHLGLEHEGLLNMKQLCGANVLGKTFELFLELKMDNETWRSYPADGFTCHVYLFTQHSTQFTRVFTTRMSPDDIILQLKLQICERLSFLKSQLTAATTLLDDILSPQLSSFLLTDNYHNLQFFISTHNNVLQSVISANNYYIISHNLQRLTGSFNAREFQALPSCIITGAGGRSLDIYVEFIADDIVMQALSATSSELNCGYVMLSNGFCELNVEVYKSETCVNLMDLMCNMCTVVVVVPTHDKVANFLQQQSNKQTTARNTSPSPIISNNHTCFHDAHNDYVFTTDLQQKQSSNDLEELDQTPHFLTLPMTSQKQGDNNSIRSHNTSLNLSSRSASQDSLLSLDYNDNDGVDNNVAIDITDELMTSAPLQADCGNDVMMMGNVQPHEDWNNLGVKFMKSDNERDCIMNCQELCGYEAMSALDTLLYPAFDRGDILSELRVLQCRFNKALPVVQWRQKIADLLLPTVPISSLQFIAYVGNTKIDISDLDVFHTLSNVSHVSVKLRKLSENQLNPVMGYFYLLDMNQPEKFGSFFTSMLISPNQNLDDIKFLLQIQVSDRLKIFDIDIVIRASSCRKPGLPINQLPTNCFSRESNLFTNDIDEENNWPMAADIKPTNDMHFYIQLLHSNHTAGNLLTNHNSVNVFARRLETILTANDNLASQPTFSIGPLQEYWLPITDGLEAGFALLLDLLALNEQCTYGRVGSDGSFRFEFQDLSQDFEYNCLLADEAQRRRESDMLMTSSGVKTLGECMDVKLSNSQGGLWCSEEACQRLFCQGCWFFLYRPLQCNDQPSNTTCIDDNTNLLAFSCISASDSTLTFSENQTSQQHANILPSSCNLDLIKDDRQLIVTNDNDLSISSALSTSNSTFVAASVSPNVKYV